MEKRVAVIGAGMAGILTAHALQIAGKQVVVLEADRIAGGQTRNTTAKITSQHGMIYGELVRTLGEEKARQYAMANEAAVEAYRRLAEGGGIDCGFETRDAWVCGNDREQLEAEAEYSYQSEAQDKLLNALMENCSFQELPGDAGMHSVSRRSDISTRPHH